jgi:hypothetical protein
MKCCTRLLAILLLAIFSGAAAAAGDPLNDSAEITDIADFPIDPCTTAFHALPNVSDWPVQPGAKFKIGKRGGKKRYITVDGDPNNIMGIPDLFVVNAGQPALGKNYCTQGGDLKSRLYVFGIGELENPLDHTRSLHAFVYVPMRVKAGTPTSLSDEFFLIVFNIVSDPVQCTGLSVDRCKALHRLADVRPPATSENNFIKKIAAEMKNILPSRPPFAAGFHNGVIHGNL